jgi:hypothetical protein
MGLPDRVNDCFAKYESRDFEGAFFAICSPVEATATSEYGRGGRSSFKRFILENLELITVATFGVASIKKLSLNYQHPELKPSDDGLYGIEDIFYHAVRCGLYHASELPRNINFIDESRINTLGEILCLPARLSIGLALAVIAAPVNAGSAVEAFPAKWMINVRGYPLFAKHAWGKRSEIAWLMEMGKTYFDQHSRAVDEQNRKENLAMFARNYSI